MKPAACKKSGQQGNDKYEKPDDRTTDDDSATSDESANEEDDDSSEECIPNHQTKTKRKLKPIQRMDNVKKPKESCVDFATSLDSDSLKIFNQFYSACLTNNLQMLTELFEVHKSNDMLSVILNRRFNTNGMTLLHLASSKGHVDCIRPLLLHDCDPTLADLVTHKVAYQMSDRKAVRDQFRRFMNDFPDKHEYKTAQVPSGFNEENKAKKRDKEKEKKRQQRKIKKEREQTFKSKQDQLNWENEEKRKFLSLTDAEKRLVIQNESRTKTDPSSSVKQKKIIEQYKKEASALKLTESNALPTILSRCWFCAENIASNTEPFEYYDFKFCSIKCLKSHRLNNKLKNTV
jgi:hypothetical protein